ncbi:unnamed protein product, partial [Symbiodinium microadriaticum]
MADESLMKSAIFIAVACTSAREWYGEVRQKLRNRASSEEYNIGLACGRGLLPYISGLLEPLSCPTKLASGGHNKNGLPLAPVVLLADVVERQNTLRWCQQVDESWRAHKEKPLPAYRRLVQRCCLQETLVREIFEELAKDSFKSISSGLERFLRQLARNFATTAINEDTFQRTTSAEGEVPSKLLSGDQAWAVPIRKKVLSEVYNFPELDVASCPAPGPVDKLPDTIYHCRRRELPMEKSP